MQFDFHFKFSQINIIMKCKLIFVIVLLNIFAGVFSSDNDGLFFILYSSLFWQFCFFSFQMKEFVFLMMKSWPKNSRISWEWFVMIMRLLNRQHRRRLLISKGITVWIQNSRRNLKVFRTVTEWSWMSWNLSHHSVKDSLKSWQMPSNTFTNLPLHNLPFSHKQN